MQQPADQQEKFKIIQCYTCLSEYPVPIDAGCTICPSCGQRSCSEG
ncbi:hypothetical protein [Paenibacillus sp. HJGM_3]